MQDKTAGEVRTNSWVTFFYGPLYMDEPVLDNQQELIYISSVRTQDVVWKICLERWTLGTDGERERERERELGKFVLAALCHRSEDHCFSVFCRDMISDNMAKENKVSLKKILYHRRHSKMEIWKFESRKFPVVNFGKWITANMATMEVKFQ